MSTYKWHQFSFIEYLIPQGIRQSTSKTRNEFLLKNHRFMRRSL
ncbi:hypothetical protein BMETH_2469_0 [methanotrophic bacterial endosymbiont of Bathymodiolus sp.]|nr:hypothetical protein BMETH_2469_0 [methanotrophic bacterial endosymbiont of Bathymodiolus sp.]